MKPKFQVRVSGNTYAKTFTDYDEAQVEALRCVTQYGNARIHCGTEYNSPVMATFLPAPTPEEEA